MSWTSPGEKESEGEVVDIDSTGVVTHGDRGDGAAEDEAAEDEDEESGKRVNAWDGGDVLTCSLTVFRYRSCQSPRPGNNESKPRSNSSCLIWIVSSAKPSVHSCGT